MGGLYLVFAFILLIIVKEPVDVEKKTEGICFQVKDLSINLCIPVKKNPNLLIGWFINMLALMPIMILEVYLMSWLNALNDEGFFPTNDDKDFFYSLEGTLGCTFGFFWLGFFGVILDKVSVKIMLPFSFLIRAGVNYMCYTIKDPWNDKIRYFATVPFISVSLYMVNMSI